MDKKKRTILIILAVALVVGFVAYKAIDAQIKAKRQAEREQRERDTVMEVLRPYMEKYGFSDMVCDHVDSRASTTVLAVVTSQSFGEASDETKLAFLAEVEYLTEQMTADSSNITLYLIAQNGLSLRVISGSYSYVETYEDGGISSLRRGTSQDAYSTSMYSPYKEVVMRMETPLAKATEEAIDEMLGTKEKCPWCNGTGAVKYYYGESTTEAILAGHEDSWYGRCGSCGGEGFIRN